MGRGYRETAASSSAGDENGRCRATRLAQGERRIRAPRRDSGTHTSRARACNRYTSRVCLRADTFQWRSRMHRTARPPRAPVACTPTGRTALWPGLGPVCARDHASCPCLYRLPPPPEGGATTVLHPSCARPGALAVIASAPRQQATAARGLRPLCRHSCEARAVNRHEKVYHQLAAVSRVQSRASLSTNSDHPLPALRGAPASPASPMHGAAART